MPMIRLFLLWIMKADNMQVYTYIKQRLGQKLLRRNSATVRFVGGKTGGDPYYVLRHSTVYLEISVTFFVNIMMAPVRYSFSSVKTDGIRNL
mgnify:CR=1 FL=1